MDYFYDGQIRRYVTQFMRIFIGFKWQASDGSEKTVPVLYGNMTRQVASIIKENSENKLPSVPRIACYITGLELDTSRLADPTFISKVNIRERRYTDVDNDGLVEYQNVQGGNYTVERLMPTPFKLTMKVDIWTSNTDQKLQLVEQIMVLFNPSLEMQTTDNYIDWTSLSVVNHELLNFSSQTIPQGADTEIDICSMTFNMPIYISPPAKVKRLGVVQSIISNVFTESGDIIGLEDLVYNQDPGNLTFLTSKHRILMFKANNGQPDNYEVTLVNPSQAVIDAGLEKETKTGDAADWTKFLDIQGGWKANISQMYFKQPSGYDLIGTFDIHPLDPSILLVTIDRDTIPPNATIDGATYVDAIIDPYKYNPLGVYGTYSGIPANTRFLMLEDVNPNNANADGPDGWKNANGSDPWIKSNSVIKWTGSAWVEIFDPENPPAIPTYVTNARTGIQYKWDGEQWLKSFEGEYAPGYWGFKLDNC